MCMLCFSVIVEIIDYVAVWRCASYVRLQEGRSVLTTKRNGDSKHRCWVGAFGGV